MKLLVINGSPRKQGRTGVASRYIQRQYKTELFDLSMEDLPIFNGDEGQTSIESVQRLRRMVAEAEGVIIASPEYHSGMSGALKNALDFLSSSHFEHKPVALLAVAGGGKGGINALNNMRVVMRGLYANAIPKQLVLDPQAFDWEKEGLTSESGEALEKLITELVLYVKMSKSM